MINILIICLIILLSYFVLDFIYTMKWMNKGIKLHEKYWKYLDNQTYELESRKNKLMRESSIYDLSGKSENELEIILSNLKELNSQYDVAIAKKKEVVKVTEDAIEANSYKGYKTWYKFFVKKLNEIGDNSI